MKLVTPTGTVRTTPTKVTPLLNIGAVAVKSTPTVAVVPVKENEYVVLVAIATLNVTG